MRIRITWKDGKKEEIESSWDAGSLKSLREKIFKFFPTTVIAIGTPAYAYYYLGEARKIEIICDHEWSEEEMRGLNKSRFFCKHCYEVKDA